MRRRIALEVAKPSGRSVGLTLVEIAFALAILSLVAVGVGASLVASLQSDTTNRERQTVRNEARSQLEAVIAWADFGTIETNFDGAAFAVGTLLAPNGDPPGVVIVDDTNPDLLRVTVRVDWVGVMGDQSLELSTLMANPEMSVQAN